ncbi:hypothetical protein EVAR_64738_1 [Eumeta japonica]|uniref:Uncharacterized protein n=1 Tax=Eumeta variegata TaxID=151549 RepID=A0A4C1Z8J3_EUMVA|nr:hypothetical protein EVAR_64738_1 [Eumeta japonica]
MLHPPLYVTLQGTVITCTRPPPLGPPRHWRSNNSAHIAPAAEYAGRGGASTPESGEIINIFHGRAVINLAAAREAQEFLAFCPVNESHGGPRLLYHPTLFPTTHCHLYHRKVIEEDTALLRYPLFIQEQDLCWAMVDERCRALSSNFRVLGPNPYNDGRIDR